jgi:hypothetical protein
MEKELAEVKQQLAAMTKKVAEMETIISKEKQPEIAVGTVCRFSDDDDAKNNPVVGILAEVSPGSDYPYRYAGGGIYSHAEPHPDYMNWVENTGVRPEGVKGTDMILVDVEKIGIRITDESDCIWNLETRYPIKRYTIVR